MPLRCELADPIFLEHNYMALIPDLSNKDHTALAATHGLEVQGLEHEKTLMGLIDEDCFQDGLNTSLAKAKEALDSGAGDDRYNSIHNKYRSLCGKIVI